MEGKILVAYGTAAGSTAEVAQAIGEEIEKAGTQVDVRPVEEIKTLEGYDALILGSAVRAFHLLAKTRKFIRKFHREIKDLPAAYFVVCLTMMDPTPENIENARKFAAPMLKIKEPIALGLFAGCMDPDKITDTFGKIMKGQPKKDCRDWDQIRAWGRETLEKFEGVR
jgi:menaquinone-dependent protoporphyrinogen oxidase